VMDAKGTSSTQSTSICAGPGLTPGTYSKGVGPVGAGSGPFDRVPNGQGLVG
jgi:hypothetical protein